MEHQPLLKHHEDGSAAKADEKDEVYQHHPARWWLLFILSCFAFEQGWIWNDWAPISNSVTLVWGWDDSILALMPNWGPIGYFIAVIPCSWIMDTKGMRWSCLVGSGLCFFGSLLRCFPMNSGLATGLVNVAQFFNGLAGPLAMSAGTVLSATWFPPTQRTTSTSIFIASNYFGGAVAFVLGPKFVTDPNSEVNPSVSDIKTQIMHYMWMHGAFAAFVFFATLIYFPSRPPNAPSRSADTARVSFSSGLKQLMRHEQFWIIACAYGLSTGMFNGWDSYLEPNLQEFLSKSSAENVSGWIGFISTVAGCVGSVGFGIFADRFSGKMKGMIIVMSGVAGLIFLWFCLACNKTLDNSTIILYVSSALGGFFLNGTVALFYELAVESTYPIAEGVTTGLLTTMNNVGCLIFLLLPEIPGLGNIWANWALAGSCFVSMGLMLFVNEHYRRTSVDYGGGLSPEVIAGLQSNIN